MSGFGILTRWEGGPTAAKVEDLQSGIAVRGRDSNTRRDLGKAVLVHAQFATTFEAQREVQPIRHVSRDVWLTADARIDNRCDLERVLSGQVEHPLDTDVDFILAAYECWGDDLARHLLGDFAFALWDAEREQVLIVRDHIGIRPVYWAESVDGGFVASSTLRATLEASGQRRTPDPVFLANFATFSGCNAEHSPWSAVRRLPGGHCLSVASDGHARTWRYWNPPDDRLDLSVEAAAAELRSLVVEAVTCRLRAPAPIGVQLSGGFDSTTVAAIAGAAIDRRELVAYSLTFPGQECDESHYIDAAEEHLQLKTRRLDALGAPPYDFIGNCHSTLDVPLLPDNEWLTPLLQLAAADGCRVVLTGQGGDHTLHGDQFAVARELLQRGERRTAWRSLNTTGYGLRVKASTLFRGTIRAHVSRHEAGLAAKLLSKRSSIMRSRQEISDRMFLGPRLRESTGPTASRFAMGRHSDRPQPGRNDQYTGDLNYFIELWDQTATDGGVEYRHPFLDVRVIEFVCRLNEAVIAADGLARGLHRRAFGDLLPQPTLDRRDKATFNGVWIKAAMPTARLVCDSDDESLKGLINQNVLREHTETCLTEPLPSFNLWSWWGAAAVGLWSLNCPPT